MKKYILVAIIVFSAFFFVDLRSAYAAVFFQDGFESGNLSHSENGTTWSNSGAGISVSSSMARTGSYSLKFHFAGSGDDAWAEQRASLGSNMTDFWIRYYLYVPTNYKHRSVSPANNKFLAIFRSPYSSPGFQINLSTEPESGGNSKLEIHYYNNGSEQSPIMPSGGGGFLSSSADGGKWAEFITHVKVLTASGSSDGVIQVWKNGTQVANETGMNDYGGSGANYINEIYLLGWANSGFDQDTDFYIDDVVFSDTPISSGSTPPSCSCTSWTSGSCGASGCASNQRQQTRTCTPSGCNTVSQCVTDSSCTTTKTGDLNNDSRVDVIDLGIFLSNWGSTSRPSSDLNSDGNVNVIDLGILLSNWG